MASIVANKGNTKKLAIWDLKEEKSNKWMSDNKKGSRLGCKGHGYGGQCQKVES